MFTLNGNLKTFFAAFALVAIGLTGAGSASAQQIVAEQMEEERRAETTETARAEENSEAQETESASESDDADADGITYDFGGSAGDTII
jgi:hypothetical protein